MPLTRTESGFKPDASFVTLAQAFSLDAGEREALLVARARVLSDDAAARLVAELLGMERSGFSSAPFASAGERRRT
jgi:hypothetical protein